MKRISLIRLNESTQSWFLISILPIIGFLIAEIVFTIAKLVPSNLHFSAQKSLEIRLFYGIALLGIPLIYFFHKKLLKPSLETGGKIQALGALFLVFVWANIHQLSHSRTVFIALLAALICFVTIPTFLEKLNSSKLTNRINSIFPTLFLIFLTVATIAICSSDANEKFLRPLCFGIGSVGLLFLFSKIKVESLQIPNWIYFIIITGVLINAFPATSFINGFHMSSILGPVIQDMHGHALLVDVESQYGLANIWFLSAIFKALGGISLFSAYYLNVFLYFVTFFMSLWILRKIFKNWLLVALGILFIISFSIWSHLPMVYSFYSLGPFRFGFFFLMLIVQIAQEKYPLKTSIWNWCEALLIGLASIWSMETAVFVILPYSALYIYEHRFKASFQRGLLAIVLFWIFAETRIWMASGQFANIRLFWEYVTLNVSDRLSSVTMAPNGTWVAVWILLASSISLGFLSFLKNQKDSLFLLLVTSLLVTSSYFVNRSIDGIFLALVPILVLLCFYYAFKIFPKKYFNHALAFLIPVWIFHLPNGIQSYYGPASTLSANNAYNMIKNISETLRTKSLAAWVEPDPCLIQKNELDLIKKYSQGNNPLYLLPSWDTDILDFMTSICLQRSNAFNLNPSIITNLSVRASEKKAQLMKTQIFSPGQIIFVYNAYFHPEAIPHEFPSREKSVTVEMFKVFKDRYSFKALETRGNLTAIEIVGLI